MFFSVGGVVSAHYCTGSVVHSGSGDLIATAGHCVYDKLFGGWNNHIVFVPGYHDDIAPYGEWVATTAYVDNYWVVQGGPGRRHSVPEGAQGRRRDADAGEHDRGRHVLGVARIHERDQRRLLPADGFRGRSGARGRRRSTPARRWSWTATGCRTGRAGVRSSPRGTGWSACSAGYQKGGNTPDHVIQHLLLEPDREDLQGYRRVLIHSAGSRPTSPRPRPACVAVRAQHR